MSVYLGCFLLVRLAAFKGGSCWYFLEACVFDFFT
jgi:hypothetical protein